MHHIKYTVNIVVQKDDIVVIYYCKIHIVGLTSFGYNFTETRFSGITAFSMTIPTLPYALGLG